LSADCAGHLPLKERIQEDVKAAMRARERERLGVLRMVSAAIKQKEIDDRISLDDGGVLAVLDKMVKQHKDALEQFRAAGRHDLADKESFELSVIESYLPRPLDRAELDSLIESTIAAVAATSMRDMGRVMSELRPKVQGRTDMADVSRLVKERLSPA